MRKITWLLACLALVAAAAVEATYFLPLHSIVRRWAGVAWVIGSATLLVTTWMAALGAAWDRQVWREKYCAWYAAALLVPPALVLVNAGGILFTSIDAEGVLHNLAGLNALRHEPDLGIFKIESTYYIAREYILESLATYIFGPGLWPARLGSIYFYLGSYIFFVSAVGRFLRSRGAANPLLLAAWCGTVIGLSSYAILMARKFEQTMAPTGCGLLFLGSLLFYLERPGPLRWLWVAWSFGFMADCYTPALAVWGLAFGVLVFLVARKRTALAGPLVYGMITLAVALTIRHRNPALNTFRMGVLEFHWTDWVSRYINSAQALFGPQHSVFPAPLLLGLLLATVTCWRAREHRFFLLLCWAAGTAITAVTFIGSYLNSAAFDTHRSLILLPPLALATTLVFAFPRPGISKLAAASGYQSALLRAGVVYMFLTSIFLPFTTRNFDGYESSTDWDECLAAISALEKQPTAEKPKLIFLRPPLDLPIDACAAYFAPGAQVRHRDPEPAERVAGTYAISFVYTDHHAHYRNPIIPSANPRPYLKVERCWP